MNSNQSEPLPMTADTANAITDALALVVMCLSRQLTEEQRDGFASLLAAVAVQAGTEGKVTLSALLSDLHEHAAS
jgi:hypothetical protein